MSRIETEELKELFAEWGLWSLIDDISPDGDGHGDNLQLTKEGLEAERMINLLLDDQSQKQPERCEHDFDLNNRCVKCGAKGVRDMTIKPEKQEGWVEEWRKLSFEIGSITKQQADEIENFISKVLDEKTFSKEELNRLSIWSGDIGTFGIVSKEDAELINKIYKLLDEENEYIKTHKEFSKLAKKQKELGERLKEILDRNSWEEEVYDGDDYSMVEYFDKETITKELIDFISQLLSERTFSKEELELILYNINYNDGDEVIYLADDEEVGKLKSKIYNLLREKE
jgi:hypothetical protein